MDIYPENKFYWSYQQTPTLLLGASDTDNLFQWTGEKLTNHLDEIVSMGGNYVRNTMSGRGEDCVYPVEENSDGLFDLSVWNQEYWRRLENFLEETSKRDIIVQIEVWDCWDTGISPFGDSDHWDNSPYNPKNNVNYTKKESGLPESWDYHPMNRDHPFYLAAPNLNDETSVFQYQEKFVKKLLSITTEYQNVLYTICNETRLPEDFSTFWARFIKENTEKPEKIFLSEMESDPNVKPINNYPNLFDFAELAQIGEFHQTRHYEKLREMRQSIKDHPAPLNIDKQYGSDEKPGRIHSTEEEVKRKMWRAIFAGCASFRFHRPGYGIGLNSSSKKMIKSMRKAQEKFNLFEGEPDNSIIGGKRADQAYALTGKDQVLIYFTDGGKIELDYEIEQKSVKWLDIENSEWIKDKPETENKKLLETPEEKGQWAALIKL